MRRFDAGFSDPKGHLIHLPNRGGLLAFGKTVPANGETDYVSGCIFILISGTAGAQFYVNQGTASSCLFVAIPDLTTLGAFGGSASLVTITAAAAPALADYPSGTVFALSAVAGFTFTLPTPTGSGKIWKFWVKTTLTSAAYILDAKTGGSEVISGAAITTGPTFYSTAANTNKISLTFTTVTGGILGDVIELQDAAANQWVINRMIVTQGGTPATPFSNH